MDKGEIICISSDDDENVEQSKTITTSNQLPVIKQPKDKCISQIKRQLSSCESESTSNSQKKRKISEVISENDVCPKNKVKVIVCEKKPISKCDSIKDLDELPAAEKSDKDKSLLKPKLVIKEKKSVVRVEQDIFPMFISLCLQKDRSEDMKTVVNKLKRRYEQLDPVYANSEAFIHFLNEKRNDIMLSKHKLYIHIAEVMTEMKNKRKPNSSTMPNGTNCALNTNQLNVSNNLANTSCFGTRNSVADDSKAKLTRSDTEKKCNSNNRKIKMVLKAMNKCEKYIKKLEEAEINFEHENNSSYIKLEKFKYRMVELYNKYCELIGESADAGRQYLRPKHFGMTGIVSVDHAITSFINSKISKRNKLKKIGAFTDALIFPDYGDILECVTKCNELHNLGLDNKKQQQIAKKAFIELGEYLQSSRRNDYWDTFSLFLENKEDDPALKDAQLAEKLIQNKQEGEKRLANIFEEYVKKQEEMKNQASDAGTSTENEENEENEEDCAENEDEDTNNIIDDISEGSIEQNLSTDENKASTDEDENGLNKSELPVNKMDNNVKPSVKKIQPDVVETEEERQLEVNSKLKNSVNNVKLRQVNSDVNVFKSERAQLIKEKLPDTVLCNLNTSTTAISLTTLDNKISIEKTKEDEPTHITVKLMNEQPMEEDKPMLRVRSFAKLPGSWKDIQEKAGHLDNSNDLIDLTQESPKQNSSVRQQASIQSRSKVPPCAKDRHRTVVIPAGKNIIKVKNITNNYVRICSKNLTRLSSPTNLQGKIVTFKGKSEGSTMIRLPIIQQLNQRASNNDQVKGSQSKENGINVQVPENNQVVFLLGKQKENTLQQPKVNVSMSQSK